MFERDWYRRILKTRWLWIVVTLLAAPVVGIQTVRSPLLGAVLLVALTALAVGIVWTEKLTRRRLVITLIVCSILLPSLPTPGSLQVRPEDLIALFVIPGVFLFGRGWRWSSLDPLFGLMGLSTVFSMAWGGWQGVPAGFRDFTELIKVVRICLFFHLALYSWTRHDVRSIMTWALIAMGLAALVGLLQWTNPAGLGEAVHTLYEGGGEDKVRIIGTTANPNRFAMMMFTGLGIAIGAWKFARRKRMIVALGSLLIWTTVVTLSRTGAVGLVIVLAVGLLLHIRKWQSARKRLAWLVVAVSVAILVGLVGIPWVTQEIQKFSEMSPTEVLGHVRQSRLNYLLYRFSVVGAQGQGLDKRIEAWRGQWKLFKESPVFGLGPAEEAYTGTVDSEYVLYLRRYGVVGLAILLLLYWRVLCFCRKLRHRQSPYQWGLGVSITAVLLAYLAANFVLYTFYQFQLMSLFWLIVGVGYSLLYFPGKEDRL